MEKGKAKKEKKYLSVLVVPHSSGDVRTFRFSALYTKLLSMGLVIITVIICLGLFLVYNVRENAKLKKYTQTLTEANIEQSKLIREKLKEIESLKHREGNRENVIKEFSDKYKQLTENYINGQINSAKSSRGGNRTEASFAKDIKELRTLLENIKKFDSPDSKGISNLSETEEKLKKYIDSVPTLIPASGRISSYFGGRRDPFQNITKFHEGIDIAADYGKNIRASASGTVTCSEFLGGYGNTVQIEHGHGLSTLYGHACELLVEKGQQVKTGDVIARVGSSGRSTGAHLHFEVKINGEPVDPMKFLDK